MQIKFAKLLSQQYVSWPSKTAS